MSKKRRGHVPQQPEPAPRRAWRAIVVGGTAVAAVAVVALAVVLNTGGRAAVSEGTASQATVGQPTAGEPTAGEPAAWSTLGTSDVHSLAFDPADPQHLYFGHHGGLLETKDGGRSWQATALRGADAMSVVPPAGDFFQIAGHDVYMETADGGQTWQDVPNDLPGLDLHAFVADPADPAHAWAFSVGNGLFETSDKGRTWELRQPGGWGALTAFVESGNTALLAVGSTGLSRSATAGGRGQRLAGRPARWRASRRAPTARSCTPARLRASAGRPTADEHGRQPHSRRSA